ncbi:acyl-CoA thioester hydrolase/BAAT C-terminal domain-containing protein [Muricoccus aerilatus]|uniref:acyl-CoA thioester hydrolase/BAAT C-terminal domain-containing protein n=1 Tax=Muricoccus aerilatus TaxID=452982 RepID=UPI000A6B808A|nr:acyl-CoA thioesterase/bile acid-CoA:amino acid N-acyltransferase family protein [Roseomonas aerilata]
MRLTVEPTDALLDVPRRIRVEGAPPGAPVHVSIATDWPDGGRWAGGATFLADSEGVVDTTRDAPTEGYAGVSPMGLVWSQQKVAAASPADATGPLAANPVHARLTAEAGEWRAEAAMTARFAASGVTRRELREDDLVGTLFMPAGEGPHPAVVVLYGSGGGVNEPRAALLASHGFAALALGYFGAPGLPRYISNTPLEMFARGIDWLRAAASPPGGFLAVSGQSRGGELALLLGATFPERVSAVVAYVPGAVVHGAMSAADPAQGGRDGHAWTLEGRPVPHVWENNRMASWSPYDDGEPPRRHAHGVRTALEDAEAVARARIPVERIRGPVLTISGTDDGSWPSTRYAEMVEEALTAANHPWPHAHLAFEGAGHAISHPYQPTTHITWPHPVSGIVATGGGTAAANAYASEASWHATLAFLRDAAANRG